MLQVVRLANCAVHYTELSDAVALRRVVAAIFGGAFVFSAMLLARHIMNTGKSLLVGLLTASVPLTMLHAQNFKEDIALAPIVLLSLLTLVRLGEAPSLGRSLVFGAAAGLAVSAKYIGAIVFPISVIFPLLYRGCATRVYFKLVAVSLVPAAFVFFCVNWNLFFELATFRNGLTSETAHALSGHVTYYPGWMSAFLFTWDNSLLPGLQPPFAYAAVVAAVLLSLHWVSCPPTIRLLLCFALVWYFLHELSPMKPLVAGARHMTVLAGVCAILVVYAAKRMANAFFLPARQAAVALLVICLGLASAWQSVKTARSTSYDTQIVAQLVQQQLGLPAVWPLAAFDVYRFDHFVRPYDSNDFLVLVEPIVLNILEAERKGSQPADVGRMAGALSKLMDRPALLIESSIGRFSYRNLPIRIVALNGSAKDLAAAAEIKGNWPDGDVTLTYLPGKP